MELCQGEPALSAALNLFLARKLAKHLKAANSGGGGNSRYLPNVIDFKP